MDWNRILNILQQHFHLTELVAAVTVFTVINSLRHRNRHGLPIWPLVGMLPSLIIGLRSNLYEWLTDVLSKQNGTFVFRGPIFSSLKCVVTSDPRNLEYMLKSKFVNFPKGEYFREILKDLLGDGIFNADNETWRRQRKIASLEFHSSKFKQMTEESLLKLVHDRLLPVLEESVTKNVSLDLQNVLLRLTFDNVCMLAFGVDPGCLTSGLPEIPFARAFEDATEATVLRFMIPTYIWKIMKIFNIGSERTLKQSIKTVRKFADEVIRTRKKELKIHCNEEFAVKKSDILTVFMGQNDEKFSDKFLRDICVNFILAGRDTSSVALSWFFWLIDKNPEVENKILDEMVKVVGERNDVKNVMQSSLVFRADEVKKMEYLQAALSEALRLYPSVPVDHKEVVEDDVFPDGTILKSGTKVVYAIYAMGRMESIWGNDCKEFKPERWLRHDGRYITESAYKFTAFNGGPRLCLGKDFAYYQMKYVAASMLFRYKVKVAEDHCVVPKLALTMYMKYGLKVNLYKRDRTELWKVLKG